MNFHNLVENEKDDFNNSNNIDNFISRWNNYVIKGGIITKEMELNFSTMLSKENGLIRKRMLNKRGEWFIENLGKFPDYVLKKMAGLKKSTFISHIYWIKAKKMLLTAPFFFIDLLGETFLLTNTTSIFPTTGLNAKDFARYRLFIETISDLIYSDELKREIVKEFNRIHGKKIERAKLPLRSNAKFVYKLKYDIKILDDFLIQTYFDYFQRGYKIQRNTLVTEYYGTPNKPNVSSIYEFAYNVFASADYRYNVYAVNETKALEEFIKIILKDPNVILKLDLYRDKYPDNKFEFHLFLTLNDIYGKKSVNLVRMWNLFRYNEAKKVLFEIKKGKKTTVYTTDYARERGRYLSEDPEIFFCEPKRGSFTQLIEAFSEESCIRKVLNGEPFCLNLEEIVESLSIGHNTCSYANNISSIPDIGIYPTNSDTMEFGLIKLQKGKLGVFGSRSIPHLEELAKSFNDPDYGTRTFTFNLFKYSDIIKEKNYASIPCHMKIDVKTEKAGVLTMGYWCKGPDWMSRFGEVFSAVRLSAFHNKTGRRNVRSINECTKDVDRWLSGGRDVLRQRKRKQMDETQLMTIIEILDLDDHKSIIRWVVNVMLKFISKYASFLCKLPESVIN